MVTSGVGGVFPPGLPVARIEAIERDSASGFARAIGHPLSHPDRYRHFLVLRVPIGAEDTAVAEAAQSNKETLDGSPTKP